MKKFKVRQLFLISKGRDDGCIKRLYLHENLDLYSN